MEMIQEAVEEFLKHVENHWPNLPKKENRKNFVRYFFSNWEDTLSFIVDSYYLKLAASCSGEIETFTQIQIGSDHHYQNISSIMVVATLLTTFFYRKNTNEFPEQLIKTIISILQNLRKEVIGVRKKIFFLTSIAGASSYFSDLGFKLIAETSFQDGYFSYSDNLANIMPGRCVNGCGFDVMVSFEIFK